MAEGQEPIANEPDLAGYQTPEELAKAYRASGAEAKRLAAEVAARDQMLQQYQQVLQQQQRPANPDPFSALEELGVPSQTIRQAIRGVVKEEVLDPLQAYQTNKTQARAKLIQKYGEDYVKFEPEIQTFANTDPEFSSTYLRLSQTDPESADELAFLKFGQTKRQTVTDKRQESRERSRQERTEASIPTSRTGGNRDDNSQFEEQMAELRKRAQQGDKTAAQRYASARYRQGLSRQFYETGHPGERG